MDDAMGKKRSYEKFLKLAPPNHPEIQKVEHRLQTYTQEGNNKKP
jgi:hypothetical protein